MIRRIRLARASGICMRFGRLYIMVLRELFEVLDNQPVYTLKVWWGS